MRIVLQRGGNAQIVILLADGKENEASFLGSQPQAYPQVGPTAADGFGNASMTVGQAPSRAATGKQFVQKFPRRRAFFPADPAAARSSGGAYARHSPARRHGQSFLPAGHAQEQEGAGHVFAGGGRIGFLLAGPRQMDAGDMHEPAAQQGQGLPARAWERDQPEAAAGEVIGQQSDCRIARRGDECVRRRSAGPLVERAPAAKTIVCRDAETGGFDRVEQFTP